MLFSLSVFFAYNFSSKIWQKLLHKILIDLFPPNTIVRQNVSLGRKKSTTYYKSLAFIGKFLV